MKINIYLIGMMGSGKSTIGRLLADRLNMSWIDMDEAIEKRGETIPQIFEKYGETEFRRIESEVAVELAKEANMIVSTGGGVILKRENVDVMKRSGKVVYLCATTDTLLRNLENGREGRPLIKDGSLENKINSLMDVRGEKYKSAADVIVETNALDPDEVAQKIINLLNL